MIRYRAVDIDAAFVGTGVRLLESCCFGPMDPCLDGTVWLSLSGLHWRGRLGQGPYAVRCNGRRRRLGR